MTCARRPSSPEPAPAPMPAVAAPPLEDENLLPEILHRLPPLPSSLPRASLVCSRWRRHVTDGRFVRRFRAHHGRSSPPPLLGFFEEVTRSLTPENPTPGGPSILAFNPILDPPDRLPVGRLSFRFHDGRRRSNLGCRDGLVLMVDVENLNVEVLVWDPVTGDEHRFGAPWVLHDRDGTEILNGAVLRTAGIDDDNRPFRFQVVMVGIDWKNKRLFACAYSSQTGKWGEPAWTSVDSPTSPTTISMRVTGTLVGNSLYWTLVGKTSGILEFDLDTQHLAVIPVPVNTSSDGSSFRAMPAAGGGLGIVELLDIDIQLWERKTNCDGVVSWVVTKTIELDRILPLGREKLTIMMMGYCEDNNVVFLWTFLGIFMVELDSLKFRKLPRSFYGLVHPFTSVYIPDMGVGGEHDGAKLLRDA